MKNMKQTPMTTTSHPMYFWILVLVLILIFGLFYFKKSSFMVKEVPTDTTGQETIDNTRELDEASQQLDKANVDATIDAELNTINQDGSVMVKY